MATLSLMASFIIINSVAEAGFLGLFSDLLASNEKPIVNSQNLPLLKANLNPDPNIKPQSDIVVVNGNALASESGPLGTIRDVEEKSYISHQISVYTVHQGDTIGEIAKMFGVTSNTIIWANDLKGKKITEGQVLVILPISGVLHIVKKGDTIKAIAKRYKADYDEIIQYNLDLDPDEPLEVGQVITVPDGDASFTQPAVVKKKDGSSPLRKYFTNDFPDYYMRPVDGVRTQGLHGYNGVDLGAPTGTPIYASAAGDIIIAKYSGYNAGYGSYIVISHNNNTQTLYGHASKVIVSVGDHVYKGQVIGYVGSTGKSTGPHLHFEVRGARNPFQ